MPVRGFTLVELLIVIVIVGVIAAVGVPQFYRMVQKARKAEAKVYLGSLYRLEHAFFSEWGTYGTNINNMGMEVKGPTQEEIGCGGEVPQNPQPRYYAFGFPQITSLCIGADGQPSPLGGAGAYLALREPRYYSDGIALYTRQCSYYFSYCADSTTTFSAVGTMSGFTATATGMISSEDPASTIPEDFDVWTMDNNGVLLNTQDGVR